MSLSTDTLLVAVAAQPLSVVVPPEPWWQSSFVAGVVGALVGGVLALAGSVLSPVVTHGLTVRVASQHVARRIRIDLLGLRRTIALVEARLNPDNGMLESFGPSMLKDLADKIETHLAGLRERATSVLDLRDERVEQQVSDSVERVAAFERLLRRWTAPLPDAREDIRIWDYSQVQAKRVSDQCISQCQHLSETMLAVSAIERWRWRLPATRPPDD